MKLRQNLWAHGLALVVASGLAWATWTKEETPVSLTRDRVQVWSGKVDQLESMRFESEKRTVEVSARSDAAGRWYEVRVDREVAAPNPHALGAGGAAPAAPAPSRQKSTFVAVTEADKLAESLAPLMALRAIGRLEGEREKEFGFDAPVGTLRVRLAGKEHALLLGGMTPGGADRYARVLESGEVFAVPGDLVRRFEQAENRLLERELNAFGEQPPDRVSVTAQGRTREFVAVEGKVGGWADAATPTEQDETVSNWMGKLGRLRVVNYVEDAKVLEGQQPTVKVKYFRAGKEVGQAELFKVGAGTAEGTAPAPGAPNERYLGRSPHTRWPVELGASAGEVERDLSSLFD
jgi:hypothetical protein